MTGRRRSRDISVNVGTNKGVKGRMGRGMTAGRVHLISAITDLLFCQIGSDLILSATADDAPVRPADDSSTGNWRTVRNGGLHSISFVKKRSSHSR